MTNSHARAAVAKAPARLRTVVANTPMTMAMVATRAPISTGWNTTASATQVTMTVTKPPVISNASGVRESCLRGLAAVGVEDLHEFHVGVPALPILVIKA